MEKRGLIKWANKPRTKSILLAFSVPKTPAQVEKELNIKKLKTPRFLAKGLLECLNPMARKGRLYVITNKVRDLIQTGKKIKKIDRDWVLLGELSASPRQKLAVLFTVDKQERTSEEIRLKASSRNPHLSRISTKETLNTLISKKLIGLSS